MFGEYYLKQFFNEDNGNALEKNILTDFCCSENSIGPIKIEYF